MKKPPLIPSLMTLFFVILMLNLGFWQLNRASEKEQLLLLLADSQVTTILDKKQIKGLPKYANVKISGHFIQAPQLLLDNQINKQVVGYHVFTPFVIDDLNLSIMVNRGWIAKQDISDDNLSIKTEHTTILGQLNSAPQVGIQLGEIQLDTKKSHQAITYYDEEKISAFLHEKLCLSLDCIVSQKILWLKADQAQGFKRDWNPIIMPPSKHMGYAVQWFAMTFVLLVIFFYWVRKTG